MTHEEEHTDRVTRLDIEDAEAADRERQTPRPRKIDLGPILAREVAAPKGPWRVVGHEIVHDDHLPNTQSVASSWIADIDPVATEEVDFIVHARQDIPDLLAEVARLTAERDALQARADEFRALVVRADSDTMSEYGYQVGFNLDGSDVDFILIEEFDRIMAALPRTGVTHHISWTLSGDHVTASAECGDEDCISRYSCPEDCEMLYDVRRDESGVSHGFYDHEGDIKPHARHEMTMGDFCNVTEYLNADTEVLPEMQEGGETFEIGRTAIEPVWHGEDGVTWKRALTPTPAGSES